MKVATKVIGLTVRSTCRYLEVRQPLREVLGHAKATEPTGDSYPFEVSFLERPDITWVEHDVLATHAATLCAYFCQYALPTVYPITKDATKSTTVSNT